MTAISAKRPPRQFEPEAKLAAIQRVHAGESKASVARDIEVPESTLRGWFKNEEKIAYLSQQSSSKTGELLDPQKKRRRIDDSSSVQPFNLSLKSNGSSPNSETCYAPDYMKNGDSTKTRLNINMKNETPKSTNEMSERERNRAELARLQMELCLYRPEMFLSAMNNSTSDLANFNTHISLLSHWNTLLMQQQSMSNQSRAPTTTDASSQMASAAASVMDPEKQSHLPKERQSVHESVLSWLRAQQSMFAFAQGHPPNGRDMNRFSASSSSTTSPVTNTNGIKRTSTSTPDQSSSQFSRTYKEEGHTHSQPPIQALPANNQEILFQHLTKYMAPKYKPIVSDENATRHNNLEQSNNKTATSTYRPSTSNNKARSALDNLLFNNENVDTNAPKEDHILSRAEALECGEMFLKWLETCSDPKITQMHITQLRTLVDKLRPEADDKFDDVSNKSKVKMK